MKENQARQNIEYILYGYANGMCDCPDMYQPLSKDEVIKYVKQELYDIKVSGHGESCVMHEGICDDLKFLSNETIDKMILAIAIDAEVLKDE